MEPARPSRIRLLLVDDHRVVTDALARLLEAEPDMEVIKTASSLSDIRQCVGARFDVALISYLLSDGNGADATRLVKSHRPDVRVIVYSRLTDAYAAARVARAGGDAFLDRDSTTKKLISMVRGNDPETGSPGASTPARRGLRAVRRKNSRRGSAPGPDGLTPRELDVLRALALGRTTRQICSELGIGHNTVRTHVQNIIAKLRVHSRLEAVSLAMRERIV